MEKRVTASREKKGCKEEDILCGGEEAPSIRSIWADGDKLAVDLSAFGNSQRGTG